MAESEEPYTCTRCGWSGLEPIRRSGESVDSFVQEVRAGREKGSYGDGGGFVEPPRMVHWSECPECNFHVQTESQREREKWEFSFAIGLLVVVIILILIG